MPEHDLLGDALERLEWDHRRAGEPAGRLAAVTRRTALTAGAAGLAAALLEACGGSPSPTTVPSTNTAPKTQTNQNAANGVFGNSTPYRFTMVNHVTNSPLFTPTQNGAADACRLLGCTYQWTGSKTGNIPELLSAINSAVSNNVNGIATTLIDLTAFNTAVEDALSAGIPVVAYNADARRNPRLAYIGQNPFASGRSLGQQIVTLLPHGGDIAIFASTLGQSNLQRTIAGVKSVLKHHKQIKHRVVGSGSTESEQLTTIEAWINAHPTFHGFFAVDGGSTAAIGQAILKYGLHTQGVVGGGFDITAVTEQLIATDQLAFTFDQQPYLQGFLSILELYLYNVSHKLSGIANVDTGLKLITRETLGLYGTTTSRFEGTGSSPGVQKISS